MQARIEDWCSVCDALTVSDFTSSTPSLIKTWQKSWGTYMLTAGDRPPVKPPTP